MNIENILNNDDYKLIFLKAILLGINYGKSNNITYYIDNIEKEINIINEKKINKNYIKNNIIEKNENTILKLENQKNYIISLIQKLSLNYSYNYSKINLLKNNLYLINNEIEKNKILLKKNKEVYEKQEKDKIILKKNYEKKENLVSELEKTLGSLSNMVI